MFYSGGGGMLPGTWREVCVSQNPIRRPLDAFSVLRMLWEGILCFKVFTIKMPLFSVNHGLGFPRRYAELLENLKVEVSLRYFVFPEIR